MTVTPSPAVKHQHFNTSHVSVRSRVVCCMSSCSDISIHLMCRFDYSRLEPVSGASPFQYISCVGSILSALSDLFSLQISIHLMCRFDKLGIVLDVFTMLFQYISCVGSIKYSHPSKSSASTISIHLMCRFDFRV